MFWIVLCLIVVGSAVAYFLGGPAGCSGDCQQGRRVCNCKGKMNE